MNGVLIEPPATRVTQAAPVSLSRCAPVALLLLATVTIARPVLDPILVRVAAALSGSGAAIDPAHPDTVITPLPGGRVASERMGFRWAGGYFLILVAAVWAAARRHPAFFACAAAAFVALMAAQIALISSASPAVRLFVRAAVPYPHILAGAAATVFLARVLRLPWVVVPLFLIAVRFLPAEASVCLLLLGAAAGCRPSGLDEASKGVAGTSDTSAGWSDARSRSRIRDPRPLRSRDA
ncbi:MAG: hypothetical protein HYY17_15035 [Planctomycetes bacterium]|nr:hypothetical protein [Planctomycetota bacterium]